MTDTKEIEQKLDTVIELLRVLAATELARSGMPQQEIGKRIHMAKAAVGEMVRGVKIAK